MPKQLLTVACIVPTIGSFPDIVKTLHNTRISLAKIGAKPVFYVMYLPPSEKFPERKELLDKVFQSPDVVPKPCDKRMGGALWEGFNDALKLPNNRAIVMLPDDYWREAKDLHQIVRPLLTKKAEISIQAWKYSKGYTGAKTFPEPQYFTETGMSKAVSFANPRLQAKGLNLLPALQKAEAEGKLLHAYAGFIALTPSAWQKTEAVMSKLFKGHEKTIDSYAFDVPVILSSQYAKLKLVNVPTERRYEHEWPTAETINTMSEHRKKQFDSGVTLVGVFLERTQPYKLPVFKSLVEQTDKRISSSTISKREGAWKRLVELRKRSAFSKGFPALKRK